MASPPKTPTSKKKAPVKRATKSEDIIDAEVVAVIPAEPKPEVKAKAVKPKTPAQKPVAKKPTPKAAPQKKPATQTSATKPAGKKVTQPKPASAKPATAKPKTETAAKPAEPKQRKGSFFGMVLGGIVAAGIGFGVAVFLNPQSWPFMQDDAAQIDPVQLELQEKLIVQADQIAALKRETDAAGKAANQAQAESNAAIAALKAELEAQPAPVGPEILPEDLQVLLNAQKSEIEALKADLDEMAAFAKAQMEAAKEQAQNIAESEERVKARSSLNQMRTALDAGTPFADTLPDIAAIVTVPATLRDTAADGVPSLASLQTEFPDAARAALSASLRETAGTTSGDRFKLFLQDQLGARSLAPREGDDPDAVLSRTEAALKNGDLAVALKTLQALPQSGQAELTIWTGKARARLDAVRGFKILSDALSAD